MTPEQLFERIKAGVVHHRNPRIDNVIHVSNLVEFCPREFALCQLEGVSYNTDAGYTPLERLLTFSLGNSIHDNMRRFLDVSNEIEEEKGHVCPQCHGYSYKEHTFRYEGFGFPITGSMDYKMEGYPLELKSIKPDSYDQLTGPLIQHELQISLYMWLAKLTGYAMNTDYGFVIYQPKAEKKPALKIYQVERNDIFIRNLTKQLKELKTFSKKNTKIPAMICHSRFNSMAKKCKTIDQCFGGTYELRR